MYKKLLFLTLAIFFLFSIFSLPATLAYNFQTSHAAIPQDFNVGKPAAGATITDAKFNNQITRIAKPSGMNGQGVAPEYSKRQAWNADESLMMLRPGDGKILIYDGQTYKYKKYLSDNTVGSQDVFWHPTNPKLLYFNMGAALYLYNIDTDAVSTVYTFKDSRGIIYPYADTGGEGNLSNDGRYYAVAGRNDSSDVKELIAIKIGTDNKGTLVSRKAVTDANDLDWMSISPLGNYVVVDYGVNDHNGTYNLAVYNRDLKNSPIWRLNAGTGHSDLAVDTDGSEILVMDYYDESLNKNVFKKFRLSDGHETDLMIFELFDDHISCRNTKRPGWCYISIFDMGDAQSTSAANWEPFADEIFALKLDGSAMNSTGGVERLGHHHSRRYGTEGVYMAEPHATVSPKGDRVVFGSNWRQDIYNEASVDPYVLDLRNGGLPPEVPPAGGTQGGGCSLQKQSAYKTPTSRGVFYITEDCAKRPFISATNYFTYFDSWSDVKIASSATLNSVPNDSLGFMPAGPLYDPHYGALVKTVKDPKVYLLLGNQKKWITSESVFNALRYQWNWIEDVDPRLLDKYQVGGEITDTTRHPDYTVIKYAGSHAVYVLENGLKRHIANEEAFNSLGYRWDRIVTVADGEIYADGAEKL